MDTQGPQPLLKWPGGKRWLAAKMMEAFGVSQQDRLIEPFVGGGALFFVAQPKDAVLGDINADLIACYRALRDAPTAVVEELQQLSINRSTYTDLATRKPRSDVERAVRMIYLNRTAFAGIWRVNRRGEFNVPFGCKPETRLPDFARIAEISTVLQCATLYAADFEFGMAIASDADLIYCDPPYTVSHNKNGFVRYNERIFSWSDQSRLAASAAAHAQAGRRIAISNAAHPEVLSLYPGSLFSCAIVCRRSDLAASPAFRGERQEALIVSKSLFTSDQTLREALSLRGLNVDVA